MASGRIGAILHCVETISGLAVVAVIGLGAVSNIAAKDGASGAPATPAANLGALSAAGSAGRIETTIYLVANDDQAHRAALMFDRASETPSSWPLDGFASYVLRAGSTVELAEAQRRLFEVVRSAGGSTTFEVIDLRTPPSEADP